MIGLLQKYKNAIVGFAIGLLGSLIWNFAIANKAVAVTIERTTEISQVNVWQAIVLGFVQGATEFIPISSTAHMKAIPVLFGWGDPGVAFTAVIQ